MIDEKNIKPEPIKERSFRFAVEIVKYCIDLKLLKHFEIANQLIKSGTSIGANIREANNGFSKKDFVFKMSIAQKETDETIYWLEIINEIESNNEKTTSLIKEANELLKIIRSISINAKKNM